MVSNASKVDPGTADYLAIKSILGQHGFKDSRYVVLLHGNKIESTFRGQEMLYLGLQILVLLRHQRT